MTRFIEGEDRRQATLLPDCLEDYVLDDNPVRVIEAFIDDLDLKALGFEGVVPEATGRPSYHPAALLKIYFYGYLNRIPSSRRLERETQRNMELMWLTGRLMPDFKTIADFRRDNGPGIRAVCTQFVTLCRRLNLFTAIPRRIRIPLQPKIQARNHDRQAHVRLAEDSPMPYRLLKLADVYA